MIRHATRVLATLAVSLTGLGAAHAAAPFQDVLVQPPTIGQPQRGSLAGSLSKLSFGAADLARGAYSLPMPVTLPQERGPLLASIVPGYSAEGGASEYGQGWGVELAITRHRVLGDLMYDDTDDFTSPWGRLVKGTDGDYYPAGLRQVVRARRLAGDAGWEVTTQEGTVFTFSQTDAVVVNADQTYAWMLSRVDTIHGDATSLTWKRNDSGRAFLDTVSWGGRHDGTQYQASYGYTPLAKAFVSYASGARLTLDRRVSQISVKAKVNGVLTERWRYDLGYTQSLLGPAFYLTSVVRTFASGQSEPPVRYDYDVGAEQLVSAQLTPQPALDQFLGSAGAAALQPDHASMTDMEQNGLTDLEHYYSYTLVKQSEDGFTFEPLPAKTGAENPLCRPDPSLLNKPRLLARMRGDLADPQVVVVRKNGTGTLSTITLCDRVGMTQATPVAAGNWELGANTRLADVDLDHRPDFVRVYNGGVQVLKNFSTSDTWLFVPMSTQALQPAIAPTASWVLDENGDGKPDLMVRTSSGVVVWLGTGGGRFETQGRPFVFRTISGLPLTNVSDWQFSHGDFNGDGLTDVILSRAQQAFVYLNQGDEFQQRMVPGLASIPFSFGYPLVGDLTASGNPEVVFVDGAHAKTLTLATPSTGLLRKADDGKGTVIELGYRRARPEPGIVYRYALLDSLTVASSGHEPVTYSYRYTHPIWHSLGHYLVGFAQATKTSPFSSETVSFHNDDDVAGVIEATVERDDRTQGVERFSSNEYEPASFRGVAWRRPQASERGVRSPDGSHVLSTRIDYEAYEHEICPVRVATSLPDGAVLSKEESLSTVDALGDLHCLPASERVSGAHPDRSLDFDYAVRIDRDGLGRVTTVTQDGPQGAVVLQQNRYDATSGRLIASGAPGRGTASLVYDALGRLREVTAADLVVTSVTRFDPLTDALLEQRVDHGGAANTSGARYDQLERLERTWDSVSATSPAQPAQAYGYTYASAGQPARTDSYELLDAGRGISRQTASLFGGDGEDVANATWGGRWFFSPLQRAERRTGRSTRSLRAPVDGVGALSTLDWQSLYGEGATELEQAIEAGFGYATSATRQVQEGVSGSRTTQWSLEGAALVERTVDNGRFVREVRKDAADRIVAITDEQGVRFEYGYDAMGRLVHASSPDGAHDVRFDGYGRPASVVRDGIASITYGYDAYGRPADKDVAAPGGQVVRTTRTSHDDRGRISEVEHERTADGATTDFTFDYDGAGADGTGAVARGQLGMLSRVRGEQYERRMSYDAAGRVTRTTVRLGGGWRELSDEPSYRVDGSVAGHHLTVKDAGGATVLETTREQTLDGFGRPRAELVDGTPVCTIAYDDEGRPGQLQLAGGTTLTFTFDPVTHARTGYQVDGPLQHGGVAWALDARGLVASETFSLAGQDDRRSYDYDARGELVRAADEREVDSYSYTASGLPDRITDASGSRGVRRSGAQLVVAGQLYRWDELGRLVQKGDLGLEYGASGELAVARRGAHEWRYFYDETGARVLKTADGAPAVGFVGGAVVTETDYVEPVVVAGVTVGVLENATFVPILTDPRGTPLLDEAGAQYLASPYGLRPRHGELATALDFTRLGYDADLGTIRMGVRDYDPLLSQFWTPDPLFLEDLEKGQGSPLEAGLYGYARNNPLAFTDPTGMESQEDENPWNYPMTRWLVNQISPAQDAGTAKRIGLALAAVPMTLVIAPAALADHAIHELSDYVYVPVRHLVRSYIGPTPQMVNADLNVEEEVHTPSYAYSHEDPAPRPAAPASHKPSAPRHRAAPKPAPRPGKASPPVSTPARTPSGPVYMERTDGQIDPSERVSGGSSTKCSGPCVRQ